MFCLPRPHESGRTPAKAALCTTELAAPRRDICSDSALSEWTFDEDYGSICLGYKWIGILFFFQSRALDDTTKRNIQARLVSVCRAEATRKINIELESSDCLSPSFNVSMYSPYKL